MSEKQMKVLGWVATFMSVMMLEIAHHIDDESRYQQVVDLGKY